MLDADAIIARVRFGDVPDTWLILRARKRSVIVPGAVGTLFCLFAIVTWISQGVTELHDPFIWGIQVTSIVCFGVFITVMTIFFVALFVHHLCRIHVPVFVLMTEGVVERHWESATKAQTISFASPLRTALASKKIMNKPPVLLVTDADGLLTEWRPSDTFGDSDLLMRAVLAAYDRYVASYQTGETEVN